MITHHTPETLKAFEQRVAEAFNAGRIRAPVHLHGGNEEVLLEIFEEIRPQDWVFSQWRSHYHCLLKGVPEDLLFEECLAGRSITLCFPEHRILTSAIVGGHLPIALGVAWQIHRAQRDERVWCFLGDMTRETGLFHECEKYAEHHDLPIDFVVEMNGKSVVTNTSEVWGFANDWQPKTSSYDYILPWPHAGAGKRVQF